MTRKIRIALVAAQFHKAMSDTMIRTAKETLSDRGMVLAGVVTVPGCFEVPLATKKLLLKKSVDAVAVLGYIEKGETLHGEVMGHVVSQTLMELQLTAMKPIGFGIIGPGATEKQARVRMKNVARGAVSAVCDVLG